MAINKKTGKSPQPYLDETITIEDRARALDTSGYTLLSTGDRNALFGKVSPDNGKDSILNVPWEVLEKRSQLGLLVGTHEIDAYATIQKKRVSEPRFTLKP